MDTICIQDLEVFFHVGVPEEERAQPQRLLLSLTLEHSLDAAAESDDLRKTIDYGTLTTKLTQFGDGKAWRLLERLAHEIAQWVLEEFGPTAVTVTVKKFIIPNARYVSVQLRREGKPSAAAHS